MKMKYYLKRCGNQELGSMRNGVPQRGRYLLTSMKTLDFFPPLSKSQLNDSALLPIIPLYSGNKVYCSYVYYNDKFHGSTATHPRNEYRIYLNKQIENNRYLFETDDIVIIRTEIITHNDEKQTVFFLDLVQDKQSALYRELNAMINSSSIGGAYAVYEGVISEFEQKVNTLKTKPEVPVVIDHTIMERIEKTDENAIAGLFNSASFRDFVMVGYEGLCAITGTVIRYENYSNLEAAHIKPKSHGGLFLPNNGMALSRDMHWAFDKGFITLNAHYNVVVHPKTTSEWLLSFDKKPIAIPKDPFFRPAFENIEYHSKNVYGLFLTSGRL
ncbi:MAG: HNH endonuclease [Oscillospiraceae bacterium]|nr:HNH endonuclease [Oscillospiraceae bacterium]